MINVELSFEYTIDKEPRQQGSMKTQPIHFTTFATFKSGLPGRRPAPDSGE
jgi:hypothetical protein